MPSRSTKFVNKGIYHIYDKTIDHKLVFSQALVSSRFLDLCHYYRSNAATLRFSLFNRMSPKFKDPIIEQITDEETFWVDIISYCLMPNHFHLLLIQKKKNGIVRFMSDITNAITRYYNGLYERKGPIFLPQFRSKRVISAQQLKHVSRYIHLNPIAANICSSFNALIEYESCSLKEYAHHHSGLCNQKILLQEFGGSVEKYIKYIKEGLGGLDLYDDEDFSEEV